jgi:Icc protein
VEVTAQFGDEDGKPPQDAVRAVINPSSGQDQLATRIAGDNQNVIGAWPDHETFATQLGPNKNGRKW